MTSHQEPPRSLVGPYQPASFEGDASPSYHSLPQMHYGLPLAHAPEPDSKKRKMEEDNDKSYDENFHTATPLLLIDKSAAAWSLNGNEPGLAARHSKLSTSKKPSVLPDRRSYKQLTGKGKQKGTNLAIERAAMKHEVQTRAYVAEPPNSAPRYQKTRPSVADGPKRSVHLSTDSESADFFPWSGHHPEDILNELTTRNGFYDKLAASQNESLTAKPSVLSSLKNKYGLQLLSSHFSSALNQRERHGTITSASTFKPPPRVTLTDTKKEAWLRDLADSEIPLRRLSRTIPHGIRGKVLLDHCLSKSIPISRAIWLVKCVGANEIRACKRKGTSGNFTVGGEAKWIKDWTTNVEQFLESVIDKCGSENWRASINYSLRLIAAIHAEYLIDRNQYYQWLINHFASNDLDTIPIWLLIINIHREDLFRCREHGTLLANAFLMQLDQARRPANKLPYDALFRELLKACKALLTRFPDCYLLPRCWNANKQIIQEHVVSGDDLLQSRFNKLALRIGKLENHLFNQVAKAPELPERTIISALDNLVNAPDYPEIANTCWMAARTADELVKSCLQWATSTFRYGRHRIYAAARLLRLWSKKSIDLQKSILDFLAFGNEMRNIDWADFHSLCAELVSSKHFSVGRYCQWLIARGALNKYRESDSNNAFEVRLLFEVPLHNLPDHVTSLRRSMLFSMGISVEQEDASVITAQAQIAEQLPAIFLKGMSSQNILANHLQVKALSRTQKSAVARWLHDRMSFYLNTQKIQGHEPRREPCPCISEQEFRTIRQIFEDLGEYVLFVDVLYGLVGIAGEGALLAAITSTMNYHFDIFNSLGTTKPIFSLLFNQRNLPSSQEATQSSFTLALLDLGVRLPDSGSAVRSLRKDEALRNSKILAAAPSPLSDNMLDAMHSDNTTFPEEMDQILTNVTTMDHATRARCFGSITSHLEKSWGEVTPFPCHYPRLLGRLRAFGEKSFDDLAAAWLETLVASSTRPPLSLVLVPLICHDIFTLGSVVESATQHGRNQSQGQGIFVALETLELLSSKESENMPSIGYKGYRFLQRRHNLLQTHLELLILLVHTCIQAAREEDGPIRSQTRRVLESDSAKSFIRLILSQFSIADKPIAQCSLPVRSALKDVLSREWILGLVAFNVREQFSQLLDSVSDLNRTLSQMSLEIIIESSLETEQDIPNILAEVLLEKLIGTHQSQVILWSHLLSTLDAVSAVPIHGRIVEAIMSEASQDQTVSSNDDDVNTEYLLKVAMATSSDVPPAAIVPLIEQILELLTKLGSSLQFSNEEDYVKPDMKTISRKTSLLLRLLAIHQTAIQNSGFPQSHLSQICLSLTYLYLHAANSSCTSLADHAFDVLAIMSDALSQDTRSRSIQTLSGSHGLLDPRVQFIFGDDEIYAGGERLRLVLGFPPAHDATKRHPYRLRHWEMMQDATPVVTENDTCLSLTLFTAKKSIV